jgi:hypothetical protein
LIGCYRSKQALQDGALKWGGIGAFMDKNGTPRGEGGTPGTRRLNYIRKDDKCTLPLGYRVGGEINHRWTQMNAEIDDR